ncbi:PH domain-containing protein [Nucisporomicrobium flavum]|uniref:PH domain-containing protein n=1 Tax=Nucisporomicrobium flavum TaxID=2785915 RepID=UPI0018F75298|nr:PH domain-containing protein [Nucisporomicrobium flavum]
MPYLEWRVRPVLPVTKLLGAAALVVLVVAFGDGDPVRWALALAAAAGLTLWAVRDLIRPVRLTADAAGVTVVSGFAARRHLPWARIERVRVDSRTRRGLRNELLEIDAGESLHLFSAHELGTDPQNVAAALTELAQRERS